VRMGWKEERRGRRRGGEGGLIPELRPLKFWGAVAPSALNQTIGGSIHSRHKTSRVALSQSRSAQLTQFKCQSPCRPRRMPEMPDMYLEYNKSQTKIEKGKIKNQNVLQVCKRGGPHSGLGWPKLHCVDRHIHSN
jgi:hypothetical protein